MCTLNHLTAVCQCGGVAEGAVWYFVNYLTATWHSACVVEGAVCSVTAVWQCGIVEQ